MSTPVCVIYENFSRRYVALPFLTAEEADIKQANATAPRTNGWTGCSISSAGGLVAQALLIGQGYASSTCEYRCEACWRVACNKLVSVARREEESVDILQQQVGINIHLVLPWIFVLLSSLY